MRVTLNPGEMATAQFLAMVRRCQNQVNGVQDQRRDVLLPAIALDMFGTISELAWFKHQGRFPDLSLAPRRGGPDDVLPDGRTVDIKSTPLANGKLIAKKGQEFHDLFVLAIVHENVVDFVGYAVGAEFICEETLGDLGHGPSHILPQHQLRRFRCDQEAG